MPIVEHECTSQQLHSLLPYNLLRIPCDPAEMAIPVAVMLKVMHNPFHELQLAWRATNAASSCTGAVIVAWWKWVRRSPAALARGTQGPRPNGRSRHGSCAIASYFFST